MKLRLRKNSLRIRLLKSEIQKLGDQKFIAEQITFTPQQILTYQIEISDSVQEIRSEFIEQKIIVKIPENIALNWIETDLVGIENEQKIENNKNLKILLEKDFVCIDRPFDKDNDDAFPHPKMKC